MSKQLTEKLHSEDWNNATEYAVEEVHFSTVDNKKAVHYLTRELNKLFVQREQPIEKAFARFLDTLTDYDKILHHNLESALSKILSRKLQKHQASQSAMVNALVGALDETVLNDYLKKIIQEELKSLTVKSPFRLAIEKFYHRWNTGLKLKIRLDSNSSYPDYREEAMQERCQQLDQLKNVLDRYQSADSRDSSTQKLLYPDDELVSTVVSILSGDKTYQESRRVIIANIATTDAFNEFLVELKSINDERISKRLIAHDNALVGLDFDIFNAIQELHAENSQRPYAHKIINILKALVLQNSKNTLRLTTENTALQEEINALTLELEDTASAPHLLEDMETENALLRSQVSELEQEVVYLKNQLKKGSESERPNRASALTGGPFSVSFG